MEIKYPEGVRMLHGGDYNPDQWLDRPDILEEDIRLMKKAGINCVSVGIFAWAALEPEDGVYTLDWLEEVIDRLYQNGIYTILATPSGAKPLWMSDAVEEVRRMSRSMVRDWSGQRHNHCYTSPYYRKKVKEINSQLSKRLGNHPGVLLWHISNEYGGTCWCPLCQSAFRKWLQKKYGTLENLNHQWWTAFWSHTYTSWEQIHAPVAMGERETHGLNLDWKRFTTEQVKDFMREEIKAVRQYSPNLPVTANFMYEFTEYDYFSLQEDLDIISWDAYPQWQKGDNTETAVSFGFWHDVMRSLKHKPFLLMESTPSMTNWCPASRLKRPGMHLASSMQAVAHGSDSVQYFQIRKSRGSFEKFHGGVIDHCGREDTLEFRDVQQVGKRLQEIGDVQGSQVSAQVAILWDVENGWAIEDEAGPRNMGMHYLETVKSHYKAFWQRGIPVDVVDQRVQDLSKYRLVIAPMAYMLRPGFPQVLASYVENGGTLVGTYHTGLVNENDLCYLGGWPGEGLREVFGIRHETTDGLPDGEENTLKADWGKSYRVSELCALIHLEGAEVQGKYGEDFYKDWPALTRHAFGKGCAWYLAAKPEQAFLQDFYDRLIQAAGICPLVEEIPHGVEVMSREGKEETFLFLQNFSGEEKEVGLSGKWRLFGGENPVETVKLQPYDSQVLRGTPKERQKA